MRLGILRLRLCALNSVHQRVFHGSSKPLGGIVQLSSEAPLIASHPRFAIQSSSVQILQQPNEFYQSLLNLIRHAKKRIMISSLYIGTEETELLESIHNALINNPKLNVHVHLDLNRSTRGGKQHASSTAHILVPLTQQFPDRFFVYMFRSPKLKGLMARVVPERFNEGWGTWHAKVYAADDEVIMSGANLNSSYFTNRQDRYIHLSNQPTLVSYIQSLLRVFGQFSYRLHQLPPADSNPRHSLSSPDGEYHLSWQNPAIHPRHFETAAEKAIKAFQTSHTDTTSKEHSVEEDTELYPLIQSGILGIHEEEETLSTLFDHLLARSRMTRPRVDLTSGYFALYQPYQERALKPGVDWRILAASPLANGFYGSKGLSGRIPEGYTLLEQKFWSRVLEEGRSWQENGDEKGGIELSEWERDGWTYHAKGIWISPDGASSSPDGPSISLFGSTNLNSRSANLDTELSFLLRTRSPVLQSRLGEEIQWLRKDAKQVDAAEWAAQGRKIGSVSYGTRIIMSIVGGML